MNTCRFDRYIQQFGLECIERNHKEQLVLFARNWAIAFALLGVITMIAVTTRTYASAWYIIDSAALSMFLLCGWQRYKFHKKIQCHRQQ